MSAEHLHAANLTVTLTTRSDAPADLATPILNITTDPPILSAILSPSPSFVPARGLNLIVLDLCHGASELPAVVDAVTFDTNARQSRSRDLAAALRSLISNNDGIRELVILLCSVGDPAANLGPDARRALSEVLGSVECESLDVGDHIAMIWRRGGRGDVAERRATIPVTLTKSWRLLIPPTAGKLISGMQRIADDITDGLEPVLVEHLRAMSLPGLYPARPGRSPAAFTDAGTATRPLSELGKAHAALTERIQQLQARLDGCLPDSDRGGVNGVDRNAEADSVARLRPARRMLLVRLERHLADLDGAMDLLASRAASAIQALRDDMRSGAAADAEREFRECARLFVKGGGVGIGNGGKGMMTIEELETKHRRIIGGVLNALERVDGVDLMGGWEVVRGKRRECVEELQGKMAELDGVMIAAREFTEPANRTSAFGLRILRKGAKQGLSISKRFIILRTSSKCSAPIYKWADKKDGEFRRQVSSFRSMIGSAEFPAEKDRYHLYISLACPWAHRTLIVRNLKGLEGVIGLSIVDPLMTKDGWHFSSPEETPGAIPDDVNGAKYIRELYFKAEKDFSGRFTVPVLWDKKTQTIVNNESSEIIRSNLPNLDLYPAALRGEIDEVNKWVYDEVNNGVYKTGFATTQEAYNKNVDILFNGLDKVEKLLEGKTWLVGDRFTEADVRLFTTIVRFDPVYHGHFKCNKGTISHSFPNILRWLRHVYQIPKVAETVNIQHIKTHYYKSHIQINPYGIVGAWNGPVLDEPKYTPKYV
ncbi:S-glutathionyl-(chloro)hydroquinone reductase [Irineochytrium annulatum]|nr:S-glutathionyl-(chloro)hydroquinone reductase [Irineochytrium annulatum]